jgi:hypothetical protein
MRKVFFSTGTIGIGMAVAMDCLVAFRHAIASDHGVIVDQPY